jgi:CDGSH-type Zn-finger protein
MARTIRHSHTGPFKLEPQPKAVFICMCGLSRNLPFCDGAHKPCAAAEEPGKLYHYDAERSRVSFITPDEA